MGSTWDPAYPRPSFNAIKQYDYLICQLSGNPALTYIICQRLHPTGELHWVGLQLSISSSGLSQPTIVDDDVFIPGGFVPARHQQVRHITEQPFSKSKHEISVMLRSNHSLQANMRYPSCYGATILYKQTWDIRHVTEQPFSTRKHEISVLLRSNHSPQQNMRYPSWYGATILHKKTWDIRNVTEHPFSTGKHEIYVMIRSTHSLQANMRYRSWYGATILHKQTWNTCHVTEGSFHTGKYETHVV